MRRLVRHMNMKTVAVTAVFFMTGLLCGVAAYAGAQGPLTERGSKQFGIQAGYAFALEKADIQFAGLSPYLGMVLTDPVGKGLLRGNVEGVVEGVFNYVFKNQRTSYTGLNLLGRYNFLPRSEHLRPYVQGGFGVVYTNLSKHGFGSKFNFASNAACGLQYFFDHRNSIGFEWRLFHVSNAGLDKDNSGLNMSNFLVGYARLF